MGTNLVEQQRDRKAFFKRLVWLEKERERIHKVEAKKRVFSQMKKHQAKELKRRPPYRNLKV